MMLQLQFKFWSDALAQHLPNLQILTNFVLKYENVSWWIFFLGFSEQLQFSEQLVAVVIIACLAALGSVSCIKSCGFLLLLFTIICSRWLFVYRQKYKKSPRVMTSQHSDVSSDDISPAHNRSKVLTARVLPICHLFAANQRKKRGIC